MTRFAKAWRKKLESEVALIHKAGGGTHNSYKQNNHHPPNTNFPLLPYQNLTWPNSFCGTSLYFEIVTGHAQVADARNQFYFRIIYIGNFNVNLQKK